ncbi:Cell shape-determining protein MreC [Candidatus Venteria ishoeyi]|uniref:Cell shape-determining protein MreC n=2 Tax=Candidatus Venteria ishoeyi TaxID=1899563 RepID=A0A1H6FFA5_9GAMM|nr:Cell shape-determining protein MreC [Candidatus Venteria ishoeyi]
MLLGFISIVLMTVDHQFNYLDNLRSMLSLGLSPLQHLVNLPIRSARDVTENLSMRRTLLMENQQLRDENLVLKVRLQRFEDLQQENQRLRLLLDSVGETENQVTIAQVMSVDLDPFSRKMRLNKGSQHHIKAGIPVFDTQGVMGQVVQADLFSSVVILITDPEHAIPVQMVRTGLHTIAVGTGSSTLSLRYLPNTADIRPGDQLITSGMGGRFPDGYPVGVVTDVQRNVGEPYTEAKARPAALLDRNRDVLLIWPEHATAAPDAVGALGTSHKNTDSSTPEEASP